MLNLKLRLSMNDDGKINWWIDTTYTVHADMKGHTGGTMFLGQGLAYCSSTKQKLVSRSSTKMEVIRSHNMLPQVLWTNNFLKAQCQTINKTTVFQDNMSSMHLEQNGQMSSGKCT